MRGERVTLPETRETLLLRLALKGVGAADLASRVKWVYGRDVNGDRQVTFREPDAIILVPPDMWLTDAGIAKICLEAP